jgi:hypothetical protein
LYPGFVKPKRGLSGGCIITDKAFSNITSRDWLSVVSSAKNEQSFKAFSTITACLIRKDYAFEIENFLLKSFGGKEQ